MYTDLIFLEIHCGRQKFKLNTFGAENIGMVNIVGLLTTSSVNDLITNVALPFLLIFAILWGMLSMVRMFGPEGRKINIVVALVITVFASMTDAWGVIVGWLAAFVGQFAFWTFVVVFIILIILWAINTTRRGYDRTAGNGTVYRNLSHIEKDIIKYRKKLQEAIDRGEQAKVQTYSETLTMLEEKKKNIVRIAGMVNH